MRLALAPFSRVEFREGDLEDLVAANRDASVLLVDTRLARTFAKGSLERAVNIPMDAGYYEIRDYLKNIDRQTPVVLFCQGAG